MHYSLLPSLPASSFEELESLLSQMSGVSEAFQVDVVDGNFVPFVSWPFHESVVEFQWEKLRSFVKEFKIEIDCMILEPEKYLNTFADLSVDSVIVHVGSTDYYSEIVRHAHTNGYKIGFALTSDVPLSFVYPYIDKINFVQVMGIKEVGKQGQPFDQRTLVTVRTLREKYPDLEIAVDGSVNAETIPLLLEAGANRFAPGSAISKAENPVAAYKQLHGLLPQ